MGLWLVQECRRCWARSGRDWDYEELTAAAAARPHSGLVVDVDDPTFLHPADMPAALAAQLVATGQRTVEDPAALVQVVLEGLALKYRWAMQKVELFTGARVRTIHIVGGGARNRTLCQLTADATGRTVLAGPVEATALGNILSQAMGRGEVGGMVEARAIARNSAGFEKYEPRDTQQWDDAYARLLSLRQSGSELQ
jgi:rhamnulokinase